MSVPVLCDPDEAEEDGEEKASKNRIPRKAIDVETSMKYMDSEGLR